MQSAHTRSAGLATACAGLVIASVGISTAFGQQYLAPGQVVRAIVDGRPWSAQPAGGPRAKITLNKDGTGTFEGPLTLSINWEVRGENFCMILGFPGTKCVRFLPVENGFEGYAEGKLDLTLSR